ncbi:tRNA-splicing endonuclease subunit Sen34 isoform X2 [Narcine bancroftii]|uniref:tRNA-splicing endonuclease subunit Sen34 isoform X2 n=1 Tax=Narcine bancroftii TaxID=1343680 RepID=UPI003831DFFA
MLLIHVAEGRALVWDAEGARLLRELHGICGSPIGSLTRQPRQNHRLGLPLSLLPEEARLLAEGGLAQLVGPPAGPDMLATETPLEDTHARQRCLALERRRQQLQALVVHIRTEQRKKGQADEETDGQDPKAEGVDSPLAPLKELEGLDRDFSFPLASCLVHLPTACPRSRTLRCLDWRHPSPHWPHPSDPTYHLRYAIYRDLRRRGYYLTAAGKFGGDFLVYPAVHNPGTTLPHRPSLFWAGDPMRFHAHYVALCLPYNRQIPLPELVTAGRLCSSVKKTVLLCSVVEGERVVCTSMSWSGIRNC